MDRYTIDDYHAGKCSEYAIGTLIPPPAPDAPPPTTPPHPLTIGIDLDHPDADRTILRRLYHKDPESFLDAYGTAGINKLMDIAVKETTPQQFPPLTDSAAWAKLCAAVAKDALKSDPHTIATPAMLLLLLHENGNRLSGLGELLRDQP